VSVCVCVCVCVWACVRACVRACVWRGGGCLSILLSNYPRGAVRNAVRYVNPETSVFLCGREGATATSTFLCCFPRDNLYMGVWGGGCQWL
jgi:hypothetical protein